MGKGFLNKFEKERFSVVFGPDILFERVHYKMKDVHQLYVDGKHFNERASERNVPQQIWNKIHNFDINEWSVVTAEVRTDRGKFVNSTWETEVEGRKFWVTIGLGNYIITIVDKTSSGVGKCVRDGELYELVRKVNKQLMEEDLASENVNVVN